jgi:hypothetical protein
VFLNGGLPLPNLVRLDGPVEGWLQENATHENVDVIAKAEGIRDTYSSDIRP